MSRMKSIINWRVFSLLLATTIASVFAVFPYVVTLQGALLRQTHMPLMVIFLLQLVQSTVIFSVFIFIGLYLATKIRFPLPLRDARIFRSVAPLAALLGCVAAVSIFVTDSVFTLLGASITTHQNPAPVWQRLLAAFYGGTTEEIVMRLFLMTLFIWIGMKAARQSRPGNIVIYLSILLSSVIFGLGHLPVTASLTAITPLIVARAIVLNGIGGVIFGLLYWKKGLESAMIAHFTADIFLLVILPTLFMK